MKRWMSGIMLLLAMIAAGAVGFRLGANAAKEPPAAEAVAMTETDPVADYRAQRQKTRQAQIAQLSDLIREDGDEAISKLAKEKLMEILELQQKEEALEGILAMRDFDGALAAVRKDSADIFLRGSPNQRQVAVIYEIVGRETGLCGEKVKIIPIN